MERHSIEIDQGSTKGISVENKIHDTPWKRELTAQNIQAKEQMAQELREMGFDTHAIARILHLEGAAQNTEKGNRAAHVAIGRKE